MHDVTIGAARQECVGFGAVKSWWYKVRTEAPYLQHSHNFPLVFIHQIHGS
jgi:hypothetical protein